MIGTSTHALILIRIAIVALRVVCPLSFTLVAVTIVHRFLPRLLQSSLTDPSNTNPLVLILRSYALAECIFYFWYRRRREWYQEHLPGRPLIGMEERKELIRNVVDALDNPKAFLEGWFLGTDISQLQRGNLADWILWAFFNESPDRASSVRALDDGERAAEIDTYVDILAEKCGTTFEPGYNPAVKCVRLTVDPVKAIHRPAVLYLAIAIFDVAISFTLWKLGYSHFIPSSTSGYRIKFPYIPLPSSPSGSCLTYWFRPSGKAPEDAREDLPIVFIHGIGAGLHFYKPFLKDLSSRNPNSAIFMIELPVVSMKIMDASPSKRDTVAALTALLASHGHSKAVFVGHSLGSVVVSWMVHLAPEYCASIVLVDPVCFLLHLPDVAYNFLHRSPTRANEWLYWYFVSNEAGIAWYLGRSFFWFENVLWLDELRALSTTTPSRDGHLDKVSIEKKTPGPRGTDRCAVFLSQNDSIVPTGQVWNLITGDSVIPFTPDGHPLSFSLPPSSPIAPSSSSSLSLSSPSPPSTRSLATKKTKQKTKRKNKRGKTITRRGKDGIVGTFWSGPGMDHAMFLMLQRARARVNDFIAAYTRGLDNSDFDL